MSEETMEMENEVEANPIQDMIQHALDQNFNKATDTFNDMMTVKMSDLLDQEKIRLADEIYNGAEPEDDQMEMDFDEDDEDLLDDEDLEDLDDEDEDEDLDEEEVEN